MRLIFDTYWTTRAIPMISLLGFLLGSCASTAPADLKAAVRVLNVYETNHGELPRRVEGCGFLGNVRASVPEQSNSYTTGFFDPSPLIETIRLRAQRKGADTAFVSIGPDSIQQDERSLRATIFYCGESQAALKLGLPVRD